MFSLITQLVYVMYYQSRSYLGRSIHIYLKLWSMQLGYSRWNERVYVPGFTAVEHSQKFVYLILVWLCFVNQLPCCLLLLASVVLGPGYMVAQRKGSLYSRDSDCFYLFFSSFAFYFLCLKFILVEFLNIHKYECIWSCTLYVIC